MKFDASWTFALGEHWIAVRVSKGMSRGSKAANPCPVATTTVTAPPIVFVYMFPIETLRSLGGFLFKSLQQGAKGGSSAVAQQAT